MVIETLDPKTTHSHNPDCPSRLVQAPDGRNWMCVDCGCYILHKRVECVPKPEEPEGRHSLMEKIADAYADRKREEGKALAERMGGEYKGEVEAKGGYLGALTAHMKSEALRQAVAEEDEKFLQPIREMTKGEEAK